MGRSPTPPAPTVVMPKDTVPQYFQTLAPQESYQDLAEQMGRIEAETAKIQQQRYDSVGTPAEIGARMAGRDVQTAGSYLASLPTTDRDTSFQTTPRPFDISTKGDHSATWQEPQTASKAPSSTQQPSSGSKFDPAISAASDRLDKAKDAYAAALARAKQPRPTGTISGTPSWATRKDEIFKPEKVS